MGDAMARAARRPERDSTTAASRSHRAGRAFRQHGSELSGRGSAPSDLAIGLLQAGLAKPKIVVGATDDPLEAEADQTANQVLQANTVARWHGDIRSMGGPPQDGLIARTPAPGEASPRSRPTDAPDGLLRHLGAGRPMDAPTRAFFEPRFDRELGDIRIHAGPGASAAASSVQAKAFTLGSDIVFGAGYGGARTDIGDRLLAHEITHVIQQVDRNAGRSAIRRQRLDPDIEGREAEPAPASTLDVEEQTELQQALGWRAKGTMPIVLNADEPTSFVVPADATYEEIAAGIGNAGGATRTDWLEIVPTGHAPLPAGTETKVVRVRAPALVSDALAAQVGLELEMRLPQDADVVVDKLRSWKVDLAVQWDLVKRTLVWGERSDWKDQAGRSYFDRFLDRLEAVRLEEPAWYTFGLTSDTQTALAWLLEQSGQGYWMLRRMIEMRSTHTVPGAKDIYKGANLAPGSPLGYAFVYEHARMVVVVERLAVTHTMQQGLLQARNAAYQGLRVVVPSPAERVFYVYAARLVMGSEQADWRLQPVEFMTFSPGERYVFNFPGAAVVYPDSFSETQPVGGEAEKSGRATILFNALAAAQGDPKAILGLDLDVLSEANTASRKELFRIILDKGIEQEGGLGLLARVILTTPSTEFLELEKLVITPSMVTRLAYQRGSGRSLLGRAYTMKALELRPLGGGALDQMPEFDVGREGSKKWWVDVQAEKVQSQAIAPSEWNPEAATKIGQEPALTGQAPGPVKQTGLRFRQGEENRPLWPWGWYTKVKPYTGVHHPSQLVRVRFAGTNEELIVSAFELAMLGPVTELWKDAFSDIMKIANLYMMYAGLRGFIGGMAEAAAMTRSLVGADLAIAEQGAAQLAKRTIQRFLFDVLVLGGSTAVNEYREELNRTPVGRAFVRLTDIAFLGLAARDVYRLFSSGVLTKLIVAAGKAIEEMGTTAPQRLLEAYDSWRAFFSTMREWTKRGLVKFGATPTGRLAPVPTDEAGFLVSFRTARAELAGQRVLGGLSLAGRSTKTAEDVLARLKELAEGEKDFAQAYSAVARRAARLTPGDVNLFLNRVRAVLDGRKGLAGKVGGLLFDAMRPGRDALAALAEAQRLLTSGLSDEAKIVLAAKAGRGRLDVAWFNELDLDVSKLDFIARDEKAPWRLFKKAWDYPWDATVQDLAEKALRGYGGEMLAEGLIPKLLPGYKALRQQAVRKSIIDFLLEEPGRLGRTPGLEVKAWRKDIWDAIGSGLYKRRRISHQAMTDIEALALNWLDNLTTQLNNAKAATKAEPFLMMSNVATKQTVNEMMLHFKAQALKPQILPFDEAALDKLVKELGTGLTGR
jgi:hypothetical protein